MEVRRISTGRVRSKRRSSGIRRYLPGGWSTKTLPVHAYLVLHPEGGCLFDTGQSARAAVPGYVPRWHPFLRLARFELSPADEVRASIEPGSVRWVVLSHLHTDHVGGLDAFADAEVFVSREEWRRATGLAGKLRGYLPQHWPTGLEPRLVDFAGPPIGPFVASHDLVGDGTLLLVPTSGHTPGHMSLVVRDARGGHLLAGDAELEPTVADYCAAEGLAVLTAHG
ncbi:MAG: MBL fold metallo-hydrolase [Gaiellaceae bacterium]